MQKTDGKYKRWIEHHGIVYRHVTNVRMPVELDEWHRLGPPKPENGLNEEQLRARGRVGLYKAGAI